jgi:hypothetical protein
MRLSLSILGVFAGLVCIASPALAQYGSRSDRSISFQHRQHLTQSGEPSDSGSFASPPRDPRTWVGDPAGRPYHYDPGFAPNGP